MKYAHYFGSAKGRYLIISDTVRPIGERFPVMGKRDAAKVAKSLNATPYNF